MLALSCTSDPEVTIEASNSLEIQLSDASLTLTRAEVEERTTVPEGKVPMLSDPSGNPLPCQWDDLDGDGQWDELFALIDIPPADQISLQLAFVLPEEFPAFNARTNVRLGANKPGYPELYEAGRLEGVSYHNYGDHTGATFQMEGPAWESDLVGFRNYMDQRNGMDIFGKTTTEMVLDSVGVAGRSSYHEPADWGMDVLKVGTSLGAGAIGYLYMDSIYRVGDKGSGSYKVVSEGSQRSIFTLGYHGWEVDRTPLDVMHEIQIAGGSRYYQSAVTYSGTDLPMNLVPGIVNMKSDTLYMMELNADYTCLLTHDNQAEDGTLLTMALMVRSDQLLSYGETKDQGDGIIQTYYAVLKAKPEVAVPYRFYALWEKEDPRWTSLDEINKFLSQEADGWAQPVSYQILP
jgi:hypothetical protein